MQTIIKNRLPGILITIAILLQPLSAAAGTYTGSFWNEFQTDAIYLFLYDSDDANDVIFDQVTFSSPSWQIADTNADSTYLKLSGPEAGPVAVQFSITFTDGLGTSPIIPFTLEWAEYLNGAPSASDAMGSITRNGSGWIVSSDFNSTVPTPIPAST